MDTPAPKDFPGPPPIGPVALHLSWSHPSGLLDLSLTNAVLKALTLGLYTFWAKTEVRKKLWSGIRIAGEPVVYTGIGKQLFFGFLFVSLVLFLPGIALMTWAVIAAGPESPVVAGLQIASYVIVLMLWGFASWRAHRFRIGNTMWRGIRGSLTGNQWTYGLTFFFTGLLIPLTLGWILPWRATKLQSLLINGTRFGNGSFKFDAPAGPLYRPFAMVWFALVVLAAIALYVAVFQFPFDDLEPALEEERRRFTGLATIAALVIGYPLYLVLSAWYRAQQENYFANHTRFEGAVLRGTQTGGGLIAASLKSYLITLFSLGILAPIAQAIMWRYWIENLHIDGAVDLEQVSRGVEDRMSRGEGLAQVFDFDV